MDNDTKEETAMIEVTLWGGYAYAVGEPEQFASISDARDEYRRRRWDRTGKYPLWGDCDSSEYVIVDTYGDIALTLNEVLGDDDWD